MHAISHIHREPAPSPIPADIVAAWQEHHRLRHDMLRRLCPDLEQPGALDAAMLELRKAAA